MSVPRLPYGDFTCTEIARLLADKLTPDFNFKEQLWFVARADEQEAAQYLCLLLRTQFGFQPRHDSESFFHDCSADAGGVGHMPFGVIMIGSYAKAIARRALVLRDARQRLQNDPSPFQFLQLPFDIRLKVYEFAFINNQILEINHHTNYSHHSTCDHSIFGNDINTGLLLTNQQIFDEAEPMLYQTRFLNIGKHLDKGLQLLRNLSPRARENIRAVPIALPYLYESDGIRRGGFDFIVKAWCQLCYYMSQNLRIRALSFTASVEALPANFVDETWVQYLIKIRGLKHLMQCDLQPLTAMEWREFSDKFPESEPESEPESYKERKVLNSRLQALLSYLKSEMCQYPASRKLTEKEKEWYWIGNPREYLEYAIGSANPIP